MSMDINIEQLDGVELVPGCPVTICAEMTAVVSDCGTVNEVTLFGPGYPGPVGLKISSIDTRYALIFRPIANAIAKQYAEEIEAHESECIARDEQPDPYYGRLLPSEML